MKYTIFPLMLLSASFSLAMQTIKMCDENALKEKLSKQGFPDFYEKTDIVESLANQEMNPLEIAQEIEFAYGIYICRLKKGISADRHEKSLTNVLLKKPLMYEAILEDNPTSLAILQNYDIYRPSFSHKHKFNSMATRQFRQSPDESAHQPSPVICNHFDALTYFEAECCLSEKQSKIQFSFDDFNWDSEKESVVSILKKNWNSVVSEDFPYTDKFIEGIFKDKKSANYEGSDLTIRVIKDDNNQVVGFITYTRFSSTYGHIEMLAIDEPFRRHGAGTLLMQNAFSDLTNLGIKNINIAVHIDNEPALRCYKKLGFFLNEMIDAKTAFFVKKII